MKNFYIDSFKIHDNDLNANGIYVQKYEGLGFPDLRLQTYNRPGEHGGFIANNLYGSRPITIEGIIFNSSITGFETSKRAMEEAVGIVKDSMGQYQPLLLKFTTMDDLALQVDVGLRNFDIKPSRTLHAVDFQLILLAPDFFLSSQDLTTISISKGSGGGVVIPAVFPMVLDASSGGSQVVTNNGNAEAYPLIYIYGPVTNPTIQNSTLSRYITLNVTLADGESIIVDMKNRTILNGTQNLYSAKEDGSQFWWLQKGNNNIQFLTTESSDTGNMEIRFRHSYLGA